MNETKTKSIVFWQKEISLCTPLWFCTIVLLRMWWFMNILVWPCLLIHLGESKYQFLLKPLKYNLSRCTLLFFKFYSNPCSFNKRSFHPSPMFRIYHIIAETTKISQAASFLYKFEICKFATFGHWWSRNFSPCKGESGVHRFFNFIFCSHKSWTLPSIHFG